ncbi:ATP-binding protein [Ruegeria sediminis]|uniref:ATP-binding protein n=1 Tax=Ruegeria sediminis TaxID=2583820 RepID=A0ABY2WU92_9RHOB|nr:ATP-binding protein [Ruegeria sediminis]TMV04870.1 ATP-binding protein [Ruegeria sediminis]
MPCPSARSDPGRDWTGVERLQDQNRLELCFPATEAAASAAIATLALRLGARGLTEERAADVKIALAEAVNNVVEHAYAGLEPARVRVECRLRPDRLDILIWDTGRPLPGLRVPAGEPASVDRDLQDLPEGGFGWFLIRQLSSAVGYERRKGWNRLSLRFDLGGPRGHNKAPNQPSCRRKGGP